MIMIAMTIFHVAIISLSITGMRAWGILRLISAEGGQKYGGKRKAWQTAWKRGQGEGKRIEDSRNQPDIYYFTIKFGLTYSYEDKYIACAFSDAIGSVRASELKLAHYGHSLVYYENLNKSNETFAIELYAHYNMLRKYPKFFAEFKRIFPNFVEQYEKILKAEKVIK